MITQIGLVAGDIWSYLEAHKGTGQLESIISGLEKERDLVLMSIGWLAREGHVTLEGDSTNYVVKLVSKREG